MENDFIEPAAITVLSLDEETKLKDTKKRDVKALRIIQQVIHDTVFSQNNCYYNFKSSLDCSVEEVSRGL